MANTVSDSEAPMPLVRPQINETADNSRTHATKTVTIPTFDGREEKSKFSIRICSGAEHEDMIALIAAANQFRAWATARGVWNTPPTTSCACLLQEWAKCLAGQACQNWEEVVDRMATPMGTTTFAIFKKCLSDFVVNKVAHDSDACFAQKDHLMSRRIPASLTFNQHFDKVKLCSNCMTWLLDAKQTTRLKNIKALHQHERENRACALMCTKLQGQDLAAGQLDENEMVALLFQTMPGRWIRQFRLHSAGDHSTKLDEMKKRMALHHADDSRNRAKRNAQNRRSPMRGGRQQGVRPNRGKSFINDRSPMSCRRDAQTRQRDAQTHPRDAQTQHCNNPGRVQHCREQPRAPSGSQRGRWGRPDRPRGRQGQGRNQPNRGGDRREQHCYQESEPPDQNHATEQRTYQCENDTFFDPTPDYLNEEQQEEEACQNASSAAGGEAEEEFNALLDVGHAFDDHIPHEDELFHFNEGQDVQRGRANRHRDACDSSEHAHDVTEHESECQEHSCYQEDTRHSDWSYDYPSCDRRHGCGCDDEHEDDFCERH